MEIEMVPMEARAQKEMGDIIQRAQSFVVRDEQSYADADLIITEVRKRVKNLEPELAPSKEAATKAWQAAYALWKKYITDPLEACKALDKKRYSWKKEEDRRREAEAERLREEERKRQAEEKLRLAERLESAGMKEQAEAVLDSPVAPVSVATPEKVEKPQGQAHVEHWVARIVDPDAVPREFCEPSQTKLNKYASLMKSKAVTPGVVYEDVGIVRRS